MYLSIYRFDGDTDELLAAYDRMTEMIPPANIDFHACVVRDDGITVFDACPDEETAMAFQSGPQFRGTLEAVGLPWPRIESAGEIHRARVLGGQVVA
jgi:hypothetical protein